MKRPTASICLALASTLLACEPVNGPLMDPGEDCVACHNSGEGPDWTFAGTVFRALDSPASDGVRGVKVHAVDATGRRVTVTSNEAGNFYLADRLTFPLQVSVERGGRTSEMEDPVLDGGCNRCHDVPPQELAAGRIVAP